MKKLYFLFIILFSAAYCFGQNYSSDRPQFNWGGWNYVNCYKGIHIRVQKAYFNNLAKQWYWNVQIQNRYGRKVALSWGLYDNTKVKSPLTNSRHTFQVNEIYSTGGFGSETQLSYLIEDLCFEFDANGLDKCSRIPNKGQYYYADCDEGTPRYRAYTANGQNTSIQGGNAQSPNGSASQVNTGSDVDSQIQAQLQKKEELCAQLSTTNTQSSICNKTSANYMTGLTGTANQITNRKYTILSDIKADVYELESLLRQSTKKQTQTAALNRETEDKQKKFDELMVQGDNALSNKSYDYAMGYYSQAQNIAVTDEQKNRARQKYNQASEAKQTEIRGQRVAAARERDKAEDVAYTAAAGAAIGAMSLLNDGYTHRGFSGKFQVGVGYDQMPMMTNQNNTSAAAASYVDKVAYPTVDFGLRFEMLNNKPVNINLRGLYSVGLHAFETGVSGSHVVTGVDGGMQFWYKTATKLKLFTDFGWYQRTGDRTRDQDAINDGTSATDEVREGRYKYQVMRLGFGPMLHFRDGGRETWIKPGVYFDKVSFAKEDKPAMSVSLNVNVRSAITIEALYSKDYPAGGTVNYPNAFTFANQDYFSVKIIRQGKLW